MGLLRAGIGINQVGGRAARGEGQTFRRSLAARGQACSTGRLLRGASGPGADVPVAHRVGEAGEQPRLWLVRKLRIMRCVLQARL